MKAVLEKNEDSEGADEASTTLYPNMNLKPRIVELLRSRPKEHDLVSQVELPNQLSQSKGSCKFCIRGRCPTVCVQCTFIRNLPLGLWTICASHLADHESNPTGSR